LSSKYVVKSGFSKKKKYYSSLDFSQFSIFQVPECQIVDLSAIQKKTLGVYV
jgi:hypothetical protein